MRMTDIEVGERYLVGEGDYAQHPAIVLETYADYTTATQYHGTGYPTKGHVNHGKGVVVEFGGSGRIETVRPNAILRTMEAEEIRKASRESLAQETRNRITEYNEELLWAVSQINDHLDTTWEIKAETGRFNQEAGQHFLQVKLTASQAEAIAEALERSSK